MPDRRTRRTIPSDVRARARELRVQGWSIPEIGRELAIARSSAWRLTKDIAPVPGTDAATRRAEAGREYWRRERVRRDAERRDDIAAATSMVGDLDRHAVLILGAVAYWAEGSKTKPWYPNERLIFVNSDADMIALFLAWIRLLGVEGERVGYRVSIHDTADVSAAEAYWADVASVDRSRLSPTTLKRSGREPRRRNTGDGYHGCLTVSVRRSKAEYRLATGLWRGIVRQLPTLPRESP